MTDPVQIDPEDYAEALAWFYECRACRRRDRERMDGMKAQIATLRAEVLSLAEHNAEQEAELAALRARRCETCQFADQCESAVEMWMDARNERIVVARDVDSCSRWTAREDGES